jgi:poly(hydroxyalkanoate) depolymerase family esterase
MTSFKDNPMALSDSMAEVLRLTRSGKLMEATALLQGGPGASAPGDTPSPGGRGDTLIDLVSDGGVWRAKPTPAAAGAAPRPDKAAAPTEQGGFEEQSWSGREGTITYKLYHPANATAGMPLVVMLHGCTQSPEDFARGTGMNALADELGFFVAYPRQTASANAQKCWNWFKPGDQQRDRGEPALLAGITRHVVAEHAIDPARVYVAGLSAGGAAAAIMAAEYPDIYAAAGIHSGLACGAARDLPSAMMAMQRGGTARKQERFVPVITFHGDRDTTVAEANSQQIIAAASAAAGMPLEVRVEEGRSPSGRRFTRKVSTDTAGVARIEQWTVEGSGHAWSGGDAGGSYTDPSGPEASREMLRFFLAQRRG